MPLAPFEDTQLSLHCLNQTALLVQVAALLIELATQILRRPELTLPRAPGTVKLLQRAQAAP
jgi:hypothetical protein